MNSLSRPGLAWFAAFIAACFVVSELHEQVHIQVGYLLNGAYGARDFNVWQLARNDGRGWIAAAAGPLFSYACMWAGGLLLRRRANTRAAGPAFALLLAGLPFARIFTVLLGGGDERVVVGALAGGASPLLVRLVATSLVLLLAGIPVLLAARHLRRRQRVTLLPLLLVLPLLVEFPLTHLAYNRLLQGGLGNTVYFGGTPLLIQLHFILMAGLLVLLRRKLFLKPAPEASALKKEKAAPGRPLLKIQ